MCGLHCFHVDYDIWSQMWDTVLDIMFSKEQLIRVGKVSSIRISLCMLTSFTCCFVVYNGNVF